MALVLCCVVVGFWVCVVSFGVVDFCLIFGSVYICYCFAGLVAV